MTEATGGVVRMIDAATLKDWLDKGEAVLVDVREAHERRTGHIPGSLSLPLSNFDAADLPDQPGRKLVFHCQAGMRCGVAAQKALAAGRPGILWRLAGGINGWKAAGQPVARG